MQTCKQALSVPLREKEQKKSVWGTLYLPMTSDMTDNPVFRSGMKWVRTGGAFALHPRTDIGEKKKQNASAAATATRLRSAFMHSLICYAR